MYSKGDQGFGAGSSSAGGTLLDMNRTPDMHLDAAGLSNMAQLGSESSSEVGRLGQSLGNPHALGCSELGISSQTQQAFQGGCLAGRHALVRIITLVCAGRDRAADRAKPKPGQDVYAGSINAERRGAWASLWRPGPSPAHLWQLPQCPGQLPSCPTALHMHSMLSTDVIASDFLMPVKIVCLQ